MAFIGPTLQGPCDPLPRWMTLQLLLLEYSFLFGHVTCFAQWDVEQAQARQRLGRWRSNWFGALVFLP